MLKVLVSSKALSLNECNRCIVFHKRDGAKFEVEYHL